MFPESIGNREIVLPNGVVCDRCNNGTLSTLDQVMCEFMPVKLRRTMLGITSKTGAVPVSKLDGGSVTHTGPSSIRVDGPKEIFWETGRSDGLIHGRFEAKGGRRMTPRYGSELARALLKSALELAWIDHGEGMLSAEFDHVRDAVLGVPHDGFLMLAKEADPEHNAVAMTYQFADEGQGRRIAVVASYYGVALTTCSGQAQPIDPPPSDVALLLTYTKADWPRLQAG